MTDTSADATDEELAIIDALATKIMAVAERAQSAP